MTKPAKLNHPSIKAGGINIYEKPSYEKPSVKKEAGGSQAPKENLSEFCLKKTAAKSDITDQIGLHLRSVYDDILAQPVPGRFVELLRQLENSSEVRSTKDGR